MELAREGQVIPRRRKCFQRMHADVVQDQVVSDDERGAGRLLRQMLSSGSNENAIMHSICFTEGRLIPTHLL